MSISNLLVDNYYNLHINGITTQTSMHVTDTTDSSNVATGSFTTLGGAGIAKNLYVGGNITCKNINYETEEIVVSTVDSTDINTGASIVFGGCSIKKNLNIGGQVKIWNSTASLDATTGALIITGGVGFGNDISTKNVNINGVLKVTNTTNSINSSTGSVIISGGMGINKDVFVAGNVNATNINSTSVGTNTIAVNATTSSTTTSVGALVVNGGVGIGGNINCGGSIFSNSYIASNIITYTTNNVVSAVGTINLSGGGDVTVTLSPIKKNGNWVKIINNKTSGVVSIKSFDNQTYVSNLPNNGGICEAICVNSASDLLHMYTNPRVYGNLSPYWANVYIGTQGSFGGNVTGYLLSSQVYITHGIDTDGYNLDVDFSYGPINYSVSGNSYICIGPLSVPSLGNSVSFLSASSNNYNKTACTASITSADPLYIYIAPYGATWATNDNNITLFSGTHIMYRYRPNEY